MCQRVGGDEWEAKQVNWLHDQHEFARTENLTRTRMKEKKCVAAFSLCLWLQNGHLAAMGACVSGIVRRTTAKDPSKEQMLFGWNHSLQAWAGKTVTNSR